MRIWAVILVLALSAWSPPSGSARAEQTELGAVTNLPVPRYVSLRSSRINVRRGPGLDYRKDWVFRRAGLPVQVVDEYGDWRRIVDKDQAGGWVYHAMITGRRTVVITADDVVFRKDPADTAAATAQAERGVVARLRKCGETWCEVEADGHRGWVPKTAVWGVDPGEIFDD
ncbi:MAG: SH3 domain-containing protein [Pseudomonadota bacterium]